MANASNEKKKPKSEKGARIPERPQDMPGGPGGGKPITPPKKKAATKGSK